MQPMLIRALARFAVLVAIVAWLVVPRSGEAPVGAPPPVSACHAQGAQLLERLPATFVPNLGQWEHPARFVSSIGRGDVFLDDEGFLLSWSTGRDSDRLRGAAVRLRLVGAGAVELVGEQRLPGKHTYLLGNDPSRWRDAPLYGAVRYRGAWPGAEVVCYEKDGHLEYDVVLEPGADLAPVEFVVEGGNALRIDVDGSLVLETAAGPLRQTPPATYAVAADGTRHEVAARYELRGENRFGFLAPQWTGAETLVLDPGLLWSTFVGGNQDDYGSALSVDAAGIVTIAGETWSQSYPTTVGAWDRTFNGFSDAVVTRLDPSLPAAQQLLFSTFVGGASNQAAIAISVDAAGIVTIAGQTGSSNYPTTAGAYDTSHNGGGPDAFVTRLDPSLPAAQQLVYSTFVGGSMGELARALSVDAAGIVTITGATVSLNYPTTTGAYDTSHNGNNDAFVTRLDPSLPAAQQLLYSTFVGGAANDQALALSVDTAGIVTIAGETSSVNYPATTGAFDTSHNGSYDAFVTRLDPSLPAAQQLLYSTFVGGVVNDLAYALSVDTAGIVTIAGGTRSSNYPTTPGAFDPSYNGGFDDAFVTRLDPALPGAQQLLYSTFVGGSLDDHAYGLSVDVSGIVTIAGETYSSNYPTTAGAFDTLFNGVGGGGSGGDAVVTRLDPALPAAQQILYSTFVGGGSTASSLWVDATGIVTITGWTLLSSYPTTPGAFDPSYNGSVDGFVTRLDMLPAGVAWHGASTPGCAGPLRSAVTSWPQIGNPSFQLLCTGAPVNSLGLLAVGAAAATTPVLLQGAAIWIDLQAPFITGMTQSTGVGAAYVVAPIPAIPALAGLQVFPQFFWQDACAPGGVSASNALAITLQP